MKVLFATNHAYLPQRSGGSESSTHDLCLELKKNKVKVSVLSSLEPTSLLGILTRFKRKAFFWGKFPKDNILGYPVYRGYMQKDDIKDVIADFNPSISVVQSHNAPMELVKSFIDEGIPTILYLRDVEFVGMDGNLIEHPLLGYIANSKFTAKKTMETFNLNPIVLEPLVYPERYRTNPIRKKVVFICPHPKKGIDIALKLAESRPDIPFEFVESWSLKPDVFCELEAKTKSLGNVKLRKRVSDMREVYKMAKVLLVPSRWEEAWGRVVTEAHFSGIPVLASNRGGLPESVGPGGILLDPDASINEWVSALSLMWDNSTIYNQLSESAMIYSKRSDIRHDVIIKKFLQILKKHLKSIT